MAVFHRLVILNHNRYLYLIHNIIIKLLTKCKYYAAQLLQNPCFELSKKISYFVNLLEISQ